ncbi:MAG: hypothetical protein KAV87_67480 [Desulfobacteraceae bacterium]|nr:hypothetical protein [Desulfobacteraceae bacterium]
MVATIEKIDLKKGEGIFITARGSTEVSAHIRESGGRLIIRGPVNCNAMTIIIEYDVKVIGECNHKSPDGLCMYKVIDGFYTDPNGKKHKPDKCKLDKNPDTICGLWPSQNESSTPVPKDL